CTPAHPYLSSDATPSTLPYTLSLHDALPISPGKMFPVSSILLSPALCRPPASRKTGRPRTDPRRISADPRWSRPRQCISPGYPRSEEHTSELQSRFDLVCRLLLEKKNKDRCH